MTEHPPDLSVVIPAYNAQDTLDEQLDAFARQHTDLEFEVLVCDNGSTDRTADIVRARQPAEPWLRLVDASARRGPAAARNVGVDAARSARIGFCDADDLVADDWVAAMHRALLTDVFVTGVLDAERLNRGSRSISWTSDAVFTMAFMPRLLTAGSNNMGIRRDVFEQVGGFHEDLRTGEDTDLSWRVQLAGRHLVLHPEIVLHVRKRAGLRPVFWQGYHYAVGDEILRGRYQKVIEALSAVGPHQDSAMTAAEEDRGALTKAKVTMARAMRAAVRERGRVITADRAHRLGYRIGAARGRRLAGSVVRLPVPDPLPDLDYLSA